MPILIILLQYFARETQCRATVYLTLVFPLFYRHINMLVDQRFLSLGIKCIEIFIVFYFRQLFAAYTTSQGVWHR